MTTILEPSKDSLNHLLMALIKTRSNAAEAGYLDLMGPWEFHEGLEPWTANPKTVETLMGLISGEKTLDRYVWANLAYIVHKSPAWSLGLAVRGYEMPDYGEALHQALAEGPK